MILFVCRRVLLHSHSSNTFENILLVHSNNTRWELCRSFFWPCCRCCFIGNLKCLRIYILRKGKEKKTWNLSIKFWNDNILYEFFSTATRAEASNLQQFKVEVEQIAVLFLVARALKRERDRRCLSRDNRSFRAVLRWRWLAWVSLLTWKKGGQTYQLLFLLFFITLLLMFLNNNPKQTKTF